MENSVLSDAAGIQKNISKMYQEYATTIGKTSDSLTQAEKAQAVYNGIMSEASMFTGAAQEMAQGYQGQQAQLNAINLELSRTIGESMIPTMTQYSSIQLSIVKGLTEFISNHKSATSGVITFTTTLLALVVGLTAAKKAYTAYKTAAATADMTTKAFTASLLINPITFIVTGIAAVVAGLAIFNTKMQESIDKMNEETIAAQNLGDAINNFMNNDMTYSKQDVDVVTKERDEMQQVISIYEEKNNKIKELEEEKNRIIDKYNSGEIYSFQKNASLDSLNKQLYDAKEELKAVEKEYMVTGKTIEEYKNRINLLNKSLQINEAKTKYNTLTNQKAHRQALINVAQTKADIQGKQELLNVLKKGKTATEEYADAKNQLVKVYPELAKVNENTIASTQSMIDTENTAADTEWALAQIQIQKSIVDLQTLINNKEEYTKIAQAMKMETWEVTASLQNQIDILGNLAKLSPEDFKGSVTTSYTPKVSRPSSSSTKTYENKALENYKKQIEHKKALDQITLKEEISMYETALRSYAKTSDEKMELREKIYDLNKELAQKEKEMLEQQTEDYEAYIQEQINKRGAEYDVQDRSRDYDKIIQMHKNYLNQIMKDERLSLDERKEIYREELQTIRDYEQQKRDLRVEAIDNTVSQLTDAITKQLEEMQEKDKEMIDKNLEEVEKWKNARIDAINKEYDARIEAIDKELEALNKAEQQKSREEEDSEYEKKKKRLEDLIAFEHDATNRANYQKQLDELVADYKKTLEERALQDKKDALQEEKDKIQEEQENKIDAIEEEADKKKEAYEKQLEELEKYYDEQIDMAQKTAEKMLLNVEENQNAIIKLLKKYGNAYEITGQTLGEKLAQGINNGLADKIQNIIQRIQDTIDAGIENKIKEWTSGMYQYEAGKNKQQPKNKTINITQNNYIEQTPEMPSETYRKLKNIDEELASQLSGI